MRYRVFLPLLLCAAVAQAEPPSFTTTSHYVPMKDGVRLAVDVHLPEGADQEHPVPALLELTRYWRAAENPETGERFPLRNELDLFFLSHGYALVKVDVRGSGASFGRRPMEYGPEEVRDGYQIVQWVTDRPWSNGKVGAYGTSYSGTTAELLAASQHPAIRAVIPGWSDFDVYRSPARPYGLMATGFIKKWSHIVGLMDDNDPAMGGLVARVDADVDGSLRAAAVREHGANPDVFEIVSKADFRDQEVSGSTAFADLSVLAWRRQIETSAVPMLVIASWLDAGTAEGALLRRQYFSNPQHLVILASMHGGGAHASPYVVGDKPLPPVPSEQEQFDLRLRFFDAHLKDKKAGIESWPAIRYFNMGEETFRQSESWPPEGNRMQRFFLAANASLGTQAPDAQGRADYAVDFGAGTGSHNRWTTQMGEAVLNLDNRGAMEERMLTYTGPVLERDLQITGTPVVRLMLEADRDDAAVLVYLSDVDPQGRSRYLTEGGLRALHRKVSESDLMPGTRAFHSFSRAHAQALKPGEPAELQFRLHPTSALIRKGHRLRLSIAGADAQIFDRVPADGDLTLSILRHKEAPSFIDLPIIEP